MKLKPKDIFGCVISDERSRLIIGRKIPQARESLEIKLSGKGTFRETLKCFR